MDLTDAVFPILSGRNRPYCTLIARGGYFTVRVDFNDDPAAWVEVTFTAGQLEELCWLTRMAGTE